MKIDGRLKKVESHEGITTKMNKYFEDKKRELQKEFKSLHGPHTHEFKEGEGI